MIDAARKRMSRGSCTARLNRSFSPSFGARRQRAGTRDHARRNAGGLHAPAILAEQSKAAASVPVVIAN